MKTQTQKTTKNAKRNCLGCSDCAGLCQAVMELALLPEVLLHSASPVR